MYKKQWLKKLYLKVSWLRVIAKIMSYLQKDSSLFL